MTDGSKLYPRSTDKGNAMKHHHYIAIILILVFLCAYLFTALQRSRNNERELSRINQQHQR
jgi:hypothetical protein